MRYLLLCFMLPLWIGALSQKDQIDGYLHYYTDYKGFLGDKGNFKKNEIEIIHDKKKILEIQEMQKMRFMKEGMNKEDAIKASRIGIIHEDGYWVWIRDAVVFPTGAEGTYNRILFKEELKNKWAGVSILPIYPDGRIALIVTYRHALRSWSLEIPRGGRQENELVEETLKRELKSETGIIASKWSLLGQMIPNSGVLAARFPVYAAIVDEEHSPQQDDFEAILCLKTLTLKEIDAAVEKGFILLKIKDKETKVEVKDSFLIYALYLAKLKGYFENNTKKNKEVAF